MPIDENVRTATQAVSFTTLHACVDGLPPVLELELAVYVPPPTPPPEDRGVDPYNSSARFDRYHDWVRVSKR